MGGGKDGVSHDYYAAFNRWNDERNVNVNRNDNDWNDNWSFGGVRNSLHFSPRASGVEFCLVSCPFQPPSILPTSSRGREYCVFFRIKRFGLPEHEEQDI